MRKTPVESFAHLRRLLQKPQEARRITVNGYAAAAVPPRSAKYASTSLKPLPATFAANLPPRLADLSCVLALVCFGTVSSFEAATSATGTSAEFASYEAVRCRNDAVTEIDGVAASGPA